MVDYTKGAKTNRVMLNLPQHPNVEPPEPGVAAVMIDGMPIHAFEYIQIIAGNDRITKVSLVFECEVGGQIGQANVKDMLDQSRER